LARRREPTVKDFFEPLDEAEVQPKPRRDPAEIRIYVKALKRALKFLPLGSRAYYYLSGEIVRANRELTSSIPPPFPKGPQQ
jgi:hypothetical protein